VSCCCAVSLIGQPDDAEGNSESVFRITAKYHHSMRKSEAPHDLCCFITINTSTSEAHHCSCSCAIGTSRCCGHVVGVLYQLADYKALNLKTVPDPVPSTSLPQQWHKPRGAKIGAIRVEDMQLSAPSSKPKSRAVSSTLYNPVTGLAMPDFADLKIALT
jgi:hypothetical protein